MKNYIKGIFQRSIFENDNGYIIGVLKVKETNDDDLQDLVNKSITFTGYFDTLKENENYILYGEVFTHPKYGLQYNTSAYERIKPQDKDGVIEFLCSDIFTGIGEKIATSIVNVLGEAALNKIIEDKNCLSLVPKLSIKKANTIYNTLIKYEESHKTIVYLTELGFTMHDALIIYNLYKTNTIMKIEHNIYDILNDTTEVNFLKIDEVATKNDLFEEINRVKACILYIIKSLSFKLGDTYLLFDEIKKEVINYLKYDFDDELFNDYLNELLLEGKIINEEDRYYDLDIYKSEMLIVNKFVRILNYKKLTYKKLSNFINNLSRENNVIYNQKQIEAITKALENRITVITGGPGTGKTTIIKAIVKLYKELNKLSEESLNEKIALIAPTGRASKRLSESTIMPACTIHRFLKWNKENNEFGINEFNKDYSKLIIIDESSMIDINLLSSLLKGLIDDIQIIFVGDYNQLPSVGPGQILKDIIDSGTIEVIKLDILYRQNNNSYIPELAKEIKMGECNNFLENHDDYNFLKCTQNSIKDNLKNICQTIISKGYNYKNFQIMAPTYLGINGIDALNKELQNIFNPKDLSKKEYIYGDVIYRENDKILQLVNMPDDNVFNGDTGIIDKIIPATISESKKSEIYVNYDGNIVKYLPKDLNKIKHGFAISIHKSQGSEFDMVVIPICMSYNRMLYRKLIYTAVTRAKKKLILIGEPNAFIKSVQNNFEYKRKTRLKEKLKILMNK